MIEKDQQKKNEQAQLDYAEEQRIKAQLAELPDQPSAPVHPNQKENEARCIAECEALRAANNGSMFGKIDIEITGPERIFTSSDEEWMKKSDEEFLEICKELRKRTQGD